MNDDLSDQLADRAEEFALTLYPNALRNGKSIALDNETTIYTAGLRTGQVIRAGQPITLLELSAHAKGTKAAGLIHARRFLGMIEPAEREERPARRREQQERLLPQAPDAERGLLSSILLDPASVIPLCCKQITPEHFHFPCNVMIYTVLVDFWHQSNPIDIITLTQRLHNLGQLDQVGGPAYVTELLSFVPTAANAQFYIDIVKDKYTRRILIQVGIDIKARAYEESEEVAEILEQAKVNVGKIESNSSNDVESFSMADLMNFKPTEDPDNLLGKRWICRGHTCLWAGGAGFGKSTLTTQAAIYWSCGLPLFGIDPGKPRKSLIIQAENDLGDTAEQFQGVLEGIMNSPDFLGDMDHYAELIKENVIIKRVISATGAKFCAILDSLCKEVRPDFVWCDPLFAFAGIDLKDQAPVSAFLRENIMPIAVRNRLAIMMIHHTGKPDKDSSAKSSWTDIEFQYLGFGSSELQNAFRAVNIILPVSGAEKTFRLILSKRGSRAGALSLDEDCSFCNGAKRLDNGTPCPRCRGTGRNPTNNLYLAHSDKGIHWMQVSKPEQQDEPKGRKGAEKIWHVDHILEVMSPTNSLTSTVLCSHLSGKKEDGKMSNGTFWSLWRKLAGDSKKGIPPSGLIERKDDGWVKL